MNSRKASTSFSMRKRARSFIFAFNGFKYLIKAEHNFRIHLSLMSVAIVLALFFNLAKTDWLFIIFAIAIVLITETINSAIEAIIDLVSPEFNKKAGLVKDIAASAVLLASVIAAIIGLIIFIPKISAFIFTFS